MNKVVQLIRLTFLLPIKALKRLYVEDYSYQASALSFITLLSLIPIISVILYLLSFFFIFNEFIIFFENYIYSNFLPEVAVSVKDYLHQFAFQAEQLPLVGIIFSFISAILMLLTIEKAFHTICDDCAKPKTLSNKLTSWLVVLLIISIIGMLAFISASLVTLPGIDQFQFILLQLINYIINSALLATFYFYIPYSDISWHDGLIGGAVSAFLFGVGTKIFSYYIIHLTNYTHIYGALAIAPIFLLWVYVSWLIILYGAILICEKKTMMKNM
jgi:membrane protein